jgi:hypothetical protein
LRRGGLFRFGDTGHLYLCSLQDSFEAWRIQDLSYIFLEGLLGDRAHIKVQIFRVADAFPKEPKIATPFERVQLLIESRAQLGQEEQMELLNCPDDRDIGIHMA